MNKSTVFKVVLNGAKSCAFFGTPNTEKAQFFKNGAKITQGVKYE